MDSTVTSPAKSVAMDEIERAIENDLTPEDRAILERGDNVYQNKTRGCDLDDWFVIWKAHNVRIKLAMRLAQTNKRTGPIYSGYLNRIMRRCGIHVDDKKMKGNLTALAWVCDDEHPERLELLAEARGEMKPGELATLNSPHTARKLIKRIVNVRSGYEPGPKRVTPIKEIAELKRENEHLKERLASAETQGSLFSWDKDNVDNISRAMIDSKRSKARDLRDALTAELDKGRNRGQTPISPPRLAEAQYLIARELRFDNGPQ